MTRPAIRHTLSAFAAVAVASAVAGSPALSDQQSSILSNSLKSSQAVLNGPSQPKAPKGLATQQQGGAKKHQHHVDPEGRMKINTPNE